MRATSAIVLLMSGPSFLVGPDGTVTRQAQCGPYNSDNSKGGNHHEKTLGAENGICNCPARPPSLRWVGIRPGANPENVARCGHRQTETRTSARYSQPTDQRARDQEIAVYLARNNSRSA